MIQPPRYEKSGEEHKVSPFGDLWWAQTSSLQMVWKIHHISFPSWIYLSKVDKKCLHQTRPKKFCFPWALCGWLYLVSNNLDFFKTIKIEFS